MSIIALVLCLIYNEFKKVPLELVPVFIKVSYFNNCHLIFTLFSFLFLLPLSKCVKKRISGFKAVYVVINDLQKIGLVDPDLFSKILSKVNHEFLLGKLCQFLTDVGNVLDKELVNGLIALNTSCINAPVGVALSH